MLPYTDYARTWLVTGVRHRDVSDCYPEFIADLQIGQVLLIIADYRDQDSFRNLGAHMEWRGRNLNVGVISTAMRDQATTYLNDDGFMEVRVLRVGEKDFWVEPLSAAPCRPVQEHTGISPLPIHPSLVPYRLPSASRLLSATQQLMSHLGQIIGHHNDWTWSELHVATDRLILLLDRYPDYCMHTLCEEAVQSLHTLIQQVQSTLVLIGQHTGMSESVGRLTEALDRICQLEADYTSGSIRARIYREEMAEMEQQAYGPHGLLAQFFGQLEYDNNRQPPTRAQISDVLQQIHSWLSRFMNGWYPRYKHSVESLASGLRYEHLTRLELYGYYVCEILARQLQLIVTGQRTLAEVMGQATQPLPTSAPVATTTAADDIDPYHILSPGINRQQLLEAMADAEAFTQGEPYKYFHIFKVLIDYHLTTLQQSDQAPFAQTLVHWHMGTRSKDVSVLKNSIRQRTDKLMDHLHLSKSRHQVLPPFWCWPDSDQDRYLCQQLAPIFERHGFVRGGVIRL